MIANGQVPTQQLAAALPKIWLLKRQRPWEDSLIIHTGGVDSVVAIYFPAGAPADYPGPAVYYQVMTSDNEGVPNLGAVFSKLTRRSESKSDSAPPSPVVGLRKAVSGES